MKDYKILSAYSAWGLAKQVKKHLENGYQPQGWIFKAWGRYYQAIIK